MARLGRLRRRTRGSKPERLPLRSGNPGSFHGQAEPCFRAKSKCLLTSVNRMNAPHRFLTRSDDASMPSDWPLASLRYPSLPLASPPITDPTRTASPSRVRFPRAPATTRLARGTVRSLAGLHQLTHSKDDALVTDTDAGSCHEPVHLVSVLPAEGTAENLADRSSPPDTKRSHLRIIRPLGPAGHSIAVRRQMGDRQQRFTRA